MNVEQMAKEDYKQGRYREGYGIPEEYREIYIEYSQYMEGLRDCENGIYSRGLGEAYDCGFGDKYQLEAMTQ